MAWPVVIATNGFGIAVTEGENGIPVEIAENGRGMPVVVVDSGGFLVSGVSAAPGTAPNAWSSGQWTLADNAAGNSLTITILTVPGLNGNTQTGTQCRINGGAWQDTALVGLGDIVIVDGTDLPNDVAADIEIRVLVAEYDWDVDGTGDEDSVSDTKSATPTLAAGETAPAQFGTGDWSIADANVVDGATLTITALPDDGGSVITDLERQVDGGAWVSLGGVTTGAYNITGLTWNASQAFSIRAVNAIGNGTASATKNVTPSGGAEADLVFAAFTTPPTTARAKLIDACIASLKTASVWTKLDGLAFASAADSAAGPINWKNPGTYNLTPVNSPTFTADQGYTGNGTNAYLSTGFVPSTAGGQMTQNSAHIGVYCRTNRTADENKYLMGCANAAYNRVLLIGPKQSGPTNDFAANGGAFNPSGYTTTLGHHIVSRTAASGSGAIKGYLNGNTTPVWSDSQTSVGLPDVAIRILASCQDTSIVRPTTDQVAAAHWGAGLDATEQAALASAINTYLTAIGANVY